MLADHCAATVGRGPAGSDAMPRLFGCDDVQKELYGVVDQARLVGEHPEAARHLAWCEACRDQLVEALIMEDAVRSGRVEPFEAPPAAAGWQRAINDMGERVHEVIGVALVRIRQGFAGFAAAPAEIAVAFEPLGATRGPTGPTEPGLGKRASLPLGDSGLVATVALDAHGDGRVHVALAVSGSISGPMSAELHAADIEGATLLAAQLFPKSPQVAFREVPAGEYVLEIREHAAAQRYRFRLRIDGAE